MMEEDIDSKSNLSWQQWRVFLAICYSNFIGVWQTYFVIFMTFPTEFRCVEPAHTGPQNATCQVNNGNHTLPCTKWEYEGPKTLIGEFDLVCDRAWLVSMAKSVYMIGFLFAVISFGQLSDLIGRYRAMIIGYSITVFSIYMTLLSSSYMMFLVLYFFQAFGRQGFQICTFVLLCETVGVKHRTKILVVFLLSWPLGGVFLPGIAWIFPDWFWFQLVIAVSFSTVAIGVALVSESPRWSRTKGNQKKQNEIEKKYEDINGKNLDENIDGIKARISEEERQVRSVKRSETIWDIFKNPQLRKRISIMYYLWPTTIFMYYAFLFNTSELAGNRYINFLLATAIDFPSYAILYWSIWRFGRRPTLAAYMMIAAVSCIVRIATPRDIVWLQTSLWMLGLMCATSSLGVLYLYSSELFPTVVRNVAVGSCSTMARVGAILAPFVKEIGIANGDWVPPLIYGSLCFIGCFMALLLPETKDQQMRDTLQEVESQNKIEEKETVNSRGDIKVQET